VGGVFSVGGARINVPLHPFAWWLMGRSSEVIHYPAVILIALLAKHFQSTCPRKYPPTRFSRWVHVITSRCFDWTYCAWGPRWAKSGESFGLCLETALRAPPMGQSAGHHAVVYRRRI